MNNTTPQSDTGSSRPNYFELLGGSQGISQLVNEFYDEMDRATDMKELRRMHKEDLSVMRQTLSEFLTGWLGGPRTYWERTNAKCMMSAHAGMHIGELEATQWATCMRRSLDKLPVDDQVRDFIDNAFTKVCTAMVNR